MAPHYRTKADGLKSNNFSFNWSSPEVKSRIGTREYPLGVWLSSQYPDVLINTPIQGVLADFENSTVVIVKEAHRTSLETKDVISDYRFSTTEPFQKAESWHEISSAAMESGKSFILLKGKRKNGQEFEAKVAILQPENWSAYNELGATDQSRIVQGNLFINVLESEEPGVCRIADAGDDLRLLRNAVIDGVRTPEGDTYLAVTDWESLRRAVSKLKATRVVLRGLSVRGDRLAALVSVK